MTDAAVGLCEAAGYRLQSLTDGALYPCSPGIRIEANHVGLFVDGATLYMKHGFLPEGPPKSEARVEDEVVRWCSAARAAKATTVGRATDPQCLDPALLGGGDEDLAHFLGFDPFYGTAAALRSHYEVAAGFDASRKWPREWAGLVPELIARAGSSRPSTQSEMDAMTVGDVYRALRALTSQSMRPSEAQTLQACRAMRSLVTGALAIVSDLNGSVRRNVARPTGALAAQCEACPHRCGEVQRALTTINFVRFSDGLDLPWLARRRRPTDDWRTLCCTATGDAPPDAAAARCCSGRIAGGRCAPGGLQGQSSCSARGPSREARDAACRALLPGSICSAKRDICCFPKATQIAGPPPAPDAGECCSGNWQRRVAGDGFRCPSR
jgi:hypothetical protein